MKAGILEFTPFVFDASDVAAELRKAGINAEVGIREGELSAGDVLLTVGGAELPGTLQGVLAAARDKGIRRIHWQLEALLPSGLPPWVHELVEDPPGVAVRPPSRLLRRVRDAREFSVYLRLSQATRHEAWTPGYLDAHAFKVPFLQTRALVSLWRKSLLDHILVSVAVRNRTLAGLGIPSSVVPVGYLPKLGNRLVARRDIDVLFIGRLSSRRGRLLRALERRLDHAGYKLRIEDALHGAERTAILNRTKIVLNIHKFPWEFPGMRLLMAMACGAVVVSETAPDTAPYAAGEHFVEAEASVDKIFSAVLATLSDDGEREAMADRAYRHVTQTLPMGPLLAAALQDRKGD